MNLLFSLPLLIPPRILGVMPLSALFILFDFVVHNPFHPETSTNVNSLEIAGSYFNRLEYATKGSLPCSLVAEFTFIARQFVHEVQSSNSSTKQSSFIKSYEHITGDPQTMTYMPSQMVKSSSRTHIFLSCHGYLTILVSKLLYYHCKSNRSHHWMDLLSMWINCFTRHLSWRVIIRQGLTWTIYLTPFSPILKYEFLSGILIFWIWSDEWGDVRLVLLDVHLYKHQLQVLKTR